MDQQRFDTVTRSLTTIPSRRDVLRGFVGVGLAGGLGRLPDAAAAKKERKKKPQGRKGLCRKDGSACKKPGKQCKRQFCLNAPFTIEARWTEQADQDTVLFVPPQNATTGPAPYILRSCRPDNSSCEAAYPFVCCDGDEQQAGDEVATFHQLLPGRYEHWIELFGETTAGEVTVILKNGAGRVVRRWANPANPATKQVGWHVFDIDGNDGRVISVDERIDQALPVGAYDPSTNVCPFNT